jgi:hypothetical protein
MKIGFVELTSLIMLLSACQPAVVQTFPQPTQPPAQPTQPSSEVAPGINLDYSIVANNVTIETVTAQPGTTEGPYWETAPQYRLLTLEGYPVAKSLRKPQIFIYTAGDLANANQNMGNIASDLQVLLQTKQTGVQLPFLPLFSEAQALHAQVQFLNLKDGDGVRFLTQLTQGMTLINNSQLFYTFQGMTSDGNYYIAAILPVSNPELPTDSNVIGEQTNAMDDYRTYLSNAITLLNEQPADAYTPDLNILDALIRSIEIK